MFEKVSERDRKKIFTTVNNAFHEFSIRSYLSFVNPGVVAFLKSEERNLRAKLMVIDSQEDMAEAARWRNSGNPVLFVFTQNMSAEQYITSVSKRIEIPETVRLRVLKASGL